MRVRGTILTPRRQYDHFPIRHIRSNRGLGLVMDAIYAEIAQGKTRIVFYEIARSRVNCLRRLGFDVCCFSCLGLGSKTPIYSFAEVSWRDSRKILPGVF